MRALYPVIMDNGVISTAILAPMRSTGNITGSFSVAHIAHIEAIPAGLLKPLKNHPRMKEIMSRVDTLIC